MGIAPDMVACSDLSRARRTAELVAAELGYDQPLVIDADLREQDLGAWNGRTGDEIATRWPAELEARRQGLLGPSRGANRATISPNGRRCPGPAGGDGRR